MKIRRTYQTEFLFIGETEPTPFLLTCEILANAISFAESRRDCVEKSGLFQHSPIDIAVARPPDLAGFFRDVQIVGASVGLGLVRCLVRLALIAEFSPLGLTVEDPSTGQQVLLPMQTFAGLALFLWISSLSFSYNNNQNYKSNICNLKN